MKVKLSEITIDPGLQPRAGLNEQHVAELLEVVDSLPPCRGVKEGNTLYLYDGFHTYEAHKRAKRQDILIDFQHGTRREAFILCLGTNARHGLRRTWADVERIMRLVFEDAELAKSSDVAIAGLCQVHRTTVAEWRKKLADKDAPRTVVRGRQTYEQIPPKKAHPVGYRQDSKVDDDKDLRQNVSQTSIKCTVEGCTTEPLAKPYWHCEKCGSHVYTTEPKCFECGAYRITQREAATTDGAGQDEPAREPGDEPEATVDAVGFPVPYKALPAFGQAEEMASICRAIDDVIRRVEAIGAGPAARLVHATSTKQTLQNVRKAIWGARPTHVCPYCHGKRDVCECCKGDGWTSKTHWETAPEEKRKRMGAATS